MSRLQRYRDKKIFDLILSPLEFVFFGNLSKDDNYIPIHGITASVSHKDRNFSVGSLNGYDVRLINREDKYQIDSKKKEVYQLIIEISLKKYDCKNPTLLLARGHDIIYKNLVTKMSSHHPVNSYETSDEINEFHSRYQVYSHTYTDLPFDSWLDTSTQQVLATHSWPFSFEIDDRDKLYVYVTGKLTTANVDRALKIGVWLADKLDS